jgi:hypothetical protein
MNRLCRQPWHIPFPRDISSLRAGYEKQGIFSSSSAVQPWKHFLDIKSNEDGEGDTVRSFGGESHIAAQESVLLGISEFIKSHSIHAVVISATNYADTYFLSQFLHTNNSGVRIVSIGSSRLFLRGATAQSRGDMVVDDFPMLPLLAEWTAGQMQSAFTKRIFANDDAQGTYFAAIDLFAPPDVGGKAFRFYPEYSAPDWGKKAEPPIQRPPMFLTTLGSDAPWPMEMYDDQQRLEGKLVPCFGKPGTPPAQGGSWRVAMPFVLFDYRCGTVLNRGQRGAPPVITHFWVLLFVFIALSVVAYCICFRYANPLTHRLCASFQPIANRRYWLFTVILPAILAGCAFQVIAAPLNVPFEISHNIAIFHWVAIGCSVVASLAISLCAWGKARSSNNSVHYAGKKIAIIVPAW